MECLIFLSTGSIFSSNGLVIIGSLIIIISYLFNLVAKKYNIPSVLLLIILGMVLHGVVATTGTESPNLTPMLEILGTVGLIMIVLEASLDLELTGGKRKLISKAFFTAIVSLLVCSSLVGGIMMLYLDVDLTTGLLYAVPLSIMS